MLKSFRTSIQGFLRSRALILMLTMAGSGFFATSCNSSEGSDDEGTEQAAPSPSAEESATENAVDNGKGIGPVTDVEIPATIDKEMATKGHELFESKCTACHNSTADKKVGPGLKDVTKRRKPEWIMNMVMNPSEMTQKDPTAKELLGTYMAQMANQSLTQEETRQVLEFLRENDSK
jgi:mono/diheme cytochrome c family protein